MSTFGKYAIPVDQTNWNVPGCETDVSFTWDYDNGRDRMLRLYDKGKQKQWDQATRIDWSLDVDPRDPSAAPDEIMPIFGMDEWEKMDLGERGEVRHHVIAWLTSQFLHGEQGALICAARIVETTPDLDSKFYAATQVMDEARHVETYGRYLREKIQLAYPMSPSLQALIQDTLTDKRWDFTYLGMQVLIEGVALAAFSMIRDFTTDPLSRSVTAYIMQDEARHIAFGRLALKDAYKELSSAELAEREEFVIEGSYLLRDRFLMREVWENLGMDGDKTVAWVDKAQIFTEFRKVLFSRIVPTVKDIGLWSPRVQKVYQDMGVMGFADGDLDAFSDNDENVAMEMERMLAERKASGAMPADDASRAHALATTIAAADD
ncbi:MAG: hypothetical protein ACI867_001392 [Glaciecola sp.]|jgi:hypothetical protein